MTNPATLGISYTFVLRFGQATLDATVTLVMGVVIAGILRRMIGPPAVRRIFGRGLNGSLRGWGVGMLLPVCSLGVIPVARELRRCGVPGGTVLAFVLTAPLLNPISFLYGLTLGEPKVILSFAVITLAKTALVAWLWEHVFGGAGDLARSAERGRVADTEVLPAAGARRVLAVVVTAARELSGHDVFYYAIGLLGNAVLSSMLPHGAMQFALFHHDKLAPLRMLAVCVPAYMSPLSGMVRIGSMFDHGNSIGAAFVLLVLGIGMCLGTLVWLVHDFGRRFVPWFAAYVMIVLGLGYACEPVLWAAGKVEADHTHAFDDLSSPFMANEAIEPAVMRSIVTHRLARQFGPSEKLALTVLGGLLAFGITLRVVDRRNAIERWLTAAPSGRAVRLDFGLSSTVIGGAAFGGLVAFSIVGAYVYFPDRVYCLDRMAAISADTRDLVLHGSIDESIRGLEQWDMVARQLQVGVFIRSFGVTDRQAKTVDDLREAIEEVRDDLRTRNLEAARRKLDRLIFHGEYGACRAAYRMRSGDTTA